MLQEHLLQEHPVEFVHPSEEPLSHQHVDVRLLPLNAYSILFCSQDLHPIYDDAHHDHNVEMMDVPEADADADADADGDADADADSDADRGGG